MKRAFDLAASASALALLSPLLALIAIAVKAESRGPVFFLQRRGGLHGRTFLIFKFRTMRTADDGKEVAQATSNDPRVTRLGAVLRRLSIDELPQLINVVRGEMSIVGPRPHAVAHDKAFEHLDARYRRRFRARPGITGLAQVSGSRGVTADDDSVRRRVSLDLAYINQWSLLLDVWIVARTALVMASPGDAPPPRGARTMRGAPARMR